VGDDARDPLNAVLAELTSVASRVDRDEMAELVDTVAGAKRIFVAGMGRSGLMARALAMRLMHLKFDVRVVGDTTTPSIRAGDLLICCSRYGRSRSLRTYIDKAHEEGAAAAVITMTPDTPLAEQADHVFVIPVEEAGGSRQPLGTVFEQSLLLYCDAMVLMAMGKLRISESDMASQHTQLE
jgi:6-phospho-3-hexuloisomerase